MIGRPARARRPAASARVVQEWQRRIAAEYRSAAITQHLTLLLTQIGASPDLILAGLRIAEDELAHARLSHQVVVAADRSAAPLPLDRGELGLQLQAEALVHGTEKSLSENESIPAVAAIKGDVESAIAATKTAIAGEDAEAIRSATTALTQVAMKIGEAVYTAKGGAAGVEGEEPSAEKAAGGEDVVDADFEEVKDDKKKSA